MAADLTLAVRVETPGGNWLELEDEANGYSIHAESFAQRSYTKRNTTADGVWVNGSWAKRSTTQNVQEPLAVWVDGEGSHFLYRTRMQALKDCLDQLSFQVQVDVGDAREVWFCTVPADYVEETSGPLMVATLGVLRATVNRLPDTTLEQI